MNAVKILIVDDEAPIRTSLRLGLQAEGWAVAEAANKAGLFAALEVENFDAITLDLMLGEDDGLELARTLRARWNLPVLMITGRAQPLDRAIGLEHGADDYIVKPFHIREVVLRIRNTLDRYRIPRKLDAGPVVFEQSTYDGRRGIIRHKGGAEVELTGTERQIFDLFIRQPGRVFSRDDISQALHGRDWSPFDRTIDGHVARLRRKLEPLCDTPTLIRSVRGVGYVFAGEIIQAPAPV